MDQLSRREFNHEHGGNPEREFNRFGVTPRPILDFSVNTSPLGPPPRVLQAWGQLAGEIERYPSVSGDGIVHFYEHRFKIPPEAVLAGNGVTELLYLVPRVLRPARVAIVTPSYADYHRASCLAGVEVLSFPLSPGEDWRAEDLSHALLQADAVLIGRPNNPTGSLLEAQRLRHLAEEFPHRWLWVDESFIQFTDRFPETSLVFAGELPPNVLVFHSLTKFYALPGLRLGAVIGEPETIGKLRSAKEPWTINRLAEKVARLLVECRSYEEETRDLILSEQCRLTSRLCEIPSIVAFPSQANFFLARWLGRSGLDALLRWLLEAGFCVRDCRNFPGLEDDFFRFAVRRPADNDRLLEALASARDPKGFV